MNVLVMNQENSNQTLPIQKNTIPERHCKNIKEVNQLKSDAAHIVTCIVGFVISVNKCPRRLDAWWIPLQDTTDLIQGDICNDGPPNFLLIGHISVGSVIILHNAVVFSPANNSTTCASKFRMQYLYLTVNCVIVISIYKCNKSYFQH